MTIGLMIVVIILWYAICEFLLWIIRRKNRWPSGLSFGIGWAQSIGVFILSMLSVLFIILKF